MALEFYKEYNMEYYNTIIENIQNRRLSLTKILVNLLLIQKIIQQILAYVEMMAIFLI